MSKTYTITYSQNAWEYEGHLRVTCKEIKKISRTMIEADGVLIEFDEEIGTIEEGK